MRRIFCTSILAGCIISGCTLTKDNYSELIDQVSGAVQSVDGGSPSSSSTPTPGQPPIFSSQPESDPPKEEPQPEKKPRSCRDTGKIVVGHNHRCAVGSVNRGCSVLRFTGSRGGLEALKSHTTGELKLGLPWDYSCSLAQDVKVCHGGKCRSAENNRTEWVNYDATFQGNMCTQWVRWGFGNTPSKVFRSIGAPKNGKGVYFTVGNCRVDLCRKQWRKEQRCS